MKLANSLITSGLTPRLQIGFLQSTKGPSKRLKLCVHLCVCVWVCILCVCMCMHVYVCLSVLWVCACITESWMEGYRCKVSRTSLPWASPTRGRQPSWHWAFLSAICLSLSALLQMKTWKTVKYSDISFFFGGGGGGRREGGSHKFCLFLCCLFFCFLSEGLLLPSNFSLPELSTLAQHFLDVSKNILQINSGQIYP